MSEISGYRTEVDEIDKQLMELFEKRLEMVGKIAICKEQQGLMVFDEKREQEILEKNMMKNEKLSSYGNSFISSLLEISRNYQIDSLEQREVPLSRGNITVGFQGVPGAYGEQALINYFGNSYKTNFYPEFEDVFEALKYEYIDYGVLPIENSTTGSIVQNYDLLKKYGYYIVGETSIKIRHHLLGLKGANMNNLTQVFSHSQGLEQCSKFLKTLPFCKQVAYANTATSAKFVKDSNIATNAAIGSERAGEIYGLEILQENISDAKENVTRFIVVSKYEQSNSICDKMTLIFSIANKIGSLYAVLNQFSNEGVNLLKIESRPVGDGSFSYYFYIDIEGNKEDSNIKKVLGEISKVTQDFKVLGCYKRKK
ncbi:hypothetical protein AN639_06345 [Candidatus Epulonipiscium fishelsonii]|uniref:Uncharacterized protein n=1 Tax=Candidatus Epulonipiscium fishelsonii TaxID=77094 RepID=A0ACC8XAU2_9FIRM|nr:hypothetical protein AN639_06345 [Epulopiscium sp. SCG-B05WGA-EpuloA1]ONI39470.1 hypothetical protein AN396_08690 [Epulopiscium sp. SCG-B11WGA-EpuloA1]